MTTKCAGMNCQSTDGTNHSPECRAEHAAAVAGGRFVKGDAGARDELITALNIARQFVPNGTEAAERVDAAISSALSIPSAPAVDAHPDDVAVDKFAVAMKEKLAQARAKGRDGWEICAPFHLSQMLREHVEKGDPRDVANFCMFLWSLGAPIEPAFDAEQNQVLTAYDKNGEAIFGTARPAASGQKLTLSPKARDALDSACSFFEIHGFDDYVSELRALLRASDSEQEQN